MILNEMKDVFVRDELVFLSFIVFLKGCNQLYFFDMLEFSYYILFGVVEIEIILEIYF